MKYYFILHDVKFVYFYIIIFVYMACFSFINMDIQNISNPYKCVFVIL